MQPIWAAAITAAAVLLGGVLTYAAAKARLRSDSGMQMIDQHQEDISELRKEAAVLRSRISSLENVQRLQGDYIGSLRRHISEGHPPPPPPYPAGLIT